MSATQLSIAIFIHVIIHLQEDYQADYDAFVSLVYACVTYYRKASKIMRDELLQWVFAIARTTVNKVRSFSYFFAAELTLPFTKSQMRSSPTRR